MPPSDAPITVSRQELSALVRLTHDLSNLMTVLLSQIDLLPANPAAPEFERMMIITGVVTKTEAALKDLLVIFGRIQDSVTESPGRIQDSVAESPSVWKDTRGCGPQPEAKEPPIFSKKKSEKMGHPAARLVQNS